MQSFNVYETRDGRHITAQQIGPDKWLVIHEDTAAVMKVCTIDPADLDLFRPATVEHIENCARTVTHQADTGTEAWFRGVISLRWKDLPAPTVNNPVKHLRNALKMVQDDASRPNEDLESARIRLKIVERISAKALTDTASYDQD